MKKRIIALTLLLLMLAFPLFSCKKDNDNTTAGGNSGSSRFNGQLESGAVVKVLENDTARELGYVDWLVAAFNDAYKDKGISAEIMNTDQYSDLAQDGPYGYGPDVWYQANDILMKYASKQHLLPLPVEGKDYFSQIPQSAWDAYRIERSGNTYYCGIPVNVQSGMLYYIESMLPDNWQANWDINGNGTPDFFETYTALYALSEDIKTNGGKTQRGYLDDMVDTYFVGGYLFSFGGYVFGKDGTDPSDIGFSAGNSVMGAEMIMQWAGEMEDEGVLDKTFASAAYNYLATGKMLCTVTTPDVYTMFIQQMVNTGKWDEASARADLKMITVPRLPKSGSLTADRWQDTVTDKENLTIETTMMGGMNGYGISSYTQCPNASLAFVEFATDYAQVVKRFQMLGISPTRADAAAEASKTDKTVGILFDRLNKGYISIMPAISEVDQIWTPAESFFIDLATDPYRAAKGEARLYDSREKIQAGLQKLCKTIYDAIFTLS